MDFSNESYVRLYVRDTTNWFRLGWEGQCTLAMALRKVDRAGILECDGTDPATAVSMHVHGPIDFIRKGVDSLIACGVATLTAEGDLFFPNFLAAQESRKSDKLRQRESRERRQAEAASGSHWPEPSQIVTDVTVGHSESHPVTLTSSSSSSYSYSSTTAVAADDGLGGDVIRLDHSKRAVAGLMWFASLWEGRSEFDVPPLESYRSSYELLGSKSPEDLARAADNIRKTTWCKENKHHCHPAHIIKKWPAYMAGPNNRKPLVSAPAEVGPSYRDLTEYARQQRALGGGQQ